MADALADEMTTQARRIAGALRKAGYAADFGVASLVEIDRFMEEQTTDGRPTPRGLLSKDLGARLFALGAYIGEVVRQHVGGKWVGDVDDPEFELNVSLRLPDRTVCFPTQRMMKRIQRGASEGIAAWGAACGLDASKSARRPRGAAVSDGQESSAAPSSEEFEVEPVSQGSKSLWRLMGLDRRPVQIGLGIWLLLGFLGGWYPLLASLALVAALLIAVVLLVLSWWDAFLYAWKNEPGFCLFFVIPLYFIRYAALTLPHTKRSIWLLLASIGLGLASFMILVPVRAAGAAVAGLLGHKVPAQVAMQKPQPVRPPPLLPPGVVPGVPPDLILRQPTAEERAAARKRNAAKKPQSLDEAIVNLDSQDRAAQLQAITYVVRATPDPARADVATKLLSMLGDKIDPLCVDGIIKWGGESHYEGMQGLVHRIKGYQLEKLLTAMIQIDSEATLDLCGKMFLDPATRWTAKSVLINQGAGSERVLVSLVGNADSDVRYAVAEILGQHGTLVALGPLSDQQALEPDKTVRRTIESAIKEIKRRAGNR